LNGVLCPLDLSLREWPEVHVLDPPGERIRDGAGGEHVRRSRDQKLAPGIRGVECLLDREEQVGSPLNLVYHGRFRRLPAYPANSEFMSQTVWSRATGQLGV
jgi:hypothetical protein